MDLEKFRNLIVNTLKIMRYVLEKKTFLASDIKARFNMPNTTVYRYLTSWVQAFYLNQEINEEESKNSSQYIYRTRPELEYYFKALSRDLRKLLYHY